jgi:hypothetical protein
MIETVAQWLKRTAPKNQSVEPASEESHPPGHVPPGKALIFVEESSEEEYTPLFENSNGFEDDLDALDQELHGD